MSRHFVTRISSLAVSVVLAVTATFAVARSEIEGITAIVVTPASGGSSAQANEPDGVKILMQEINEQRPKLWKPYRGKLGPCAVRFTFFEQDRRVARLVLDGNELVEFEPASATVGSSRVVYPSELAGIRRLASKVKDQRSCGK